MLLDACLWDSRGVEDFQGRAIQNLINIEQDDRVKAFICTQDLKDEDYINNHYVIMATKKVRSKPVWSSTPVHGPMVSTPLPSRKMNCWSKLTNGNSQILLAVKSEKH